MRNLYIVALFLLRVISPLNAQLPDSAFVLGGVGVGSGLSVDASNLPVYAGSHECGEFTSGNAFLLSLDARLVLPSLIADHVGLDARLGGSYTSGRLTALPVTPTPIFDEVTGERVILDREFHLDSKLLTLSFNVLARYETGRFAIALGPSLGYRLSSSFEQTDNVLGPGDYRFPDGQPSHPMTDGPVLTPAGLSFGPLLALSYLIPAGPRTTIAPEFAARYDLLSPVQDADWRSLQLHLGGAILFDLTPVATPAPPVAVAAPHPPRLTASIDIFAVDSEGRRLTVPTVHVREVLYRQHSPLLPSIFFEGDSAILPDRYRKLEEEQTDSFRVSGLVGKSVLDIQHDALNVIGLRMQQNPGVNLTLYGSISGGEDARLSGRRVNSVRQYLTDVWNIAPDRLLTGDGSGPLQRSNEVTEDGRVENRRVELVASDAGVLAPVMTEEIEQQFDPPMLQLSPKFDAEAGVRDWGIVIRQGGEELSRFSKGDTAAEGSPEIVWDLIRNQLDSVLSPVEAELTVEDSTGQMITARSQVPLLLERSTQIIDKRVELHGDQERIDYSLVAFDYRSAELQPWHRREIRSIAASIQPGATVTVTGYTDRIGDERLNVALSTQRAESIATALRTWVDALGIQDVRITSSGAGIETARFANDLPEGRVLSRGAGIVIEQKVEGGDQ